MSDTDSPSDSSPAGSSSHVLADPTTVENTLFASKAGNIEIISQFGNSYLISDGEKQVNIPKTPRFELSYIYDRSDFAFGTTTDPIEFKLDKNITITPEKQKDMYRIDAEGLRSVVTPPSEAPEVLDAVVRIIQSEEKRRFKQTKLGDVYNRVVEEQIDLDYINRIQQKHSILPPAAVQVDSAGWIINDLFVLTRESNVLLNTAEKSEELHHITEGGTVQNTTQVEILDLSVSSNLNPPTEISGKEMNFIATAQWLVNYREMYPDDLYWDKIEEYVLKSG